MRTVMLTRQVGRKRVSRKTQWIGSHGWTLMVLVGRTLFRLHALGGCGIGIAARRNSQGFWEEITDEWMLRRSLVKRKRQADAARPAARHLAPLESVVLGKFQQILNHCAVLQYDDNEPRKPGWVTLKTMGSSWVLEFKDPDSCSRLVVVAADLDDALALAQVLLESEEAPWEPDPWLKQQDARGKAKK